MAHLQELSKGETEPNTAIGSVLSPDKPPIESPKEPALTTTSVKDSKDSDTDEAQHEPPEFADIPEIVRNVVTFEDDPSAPALTFRSILLSILFCVLGSVVSQLSYFRTTSAPFPVYFVILASAPLGKFMARVLPNYAVPLGQYSFSLNPGPFNVKEHAIIGIAANTGSQGQWATYLPTNAALYYGITMNPVVALVFGWGSSMLGFAFAAMVRGVMIDDPAFIFPLSLQQVTLYRTMDSKSREHIGRAAQQMKVFWILLLGIFVWQFLPEFLFPFVGSLAPLCWIASRNRTVNFLGAGRGGMAVLNFTLNWSNITSTVVTSPYYVQVIIFITFVMTMWILVPIAKFGNVWGSPTFNVMSNGLYQTNGSAYPFQSLIYLDSNGVHQFNETKYEEVGLAYSGAMFTWQMFMSLGSYVSAFVWCGLFLGPKLVAIWKSRRRGEEYHQDRLSEIIRHYPGVKKWEWAVVGLVPVLTLLGVVASKTVYMPLWTYFVALGFGAAAMLPMSLVYAMTGFSVRVGYFNELIYGYMIEAKGSSRHPLGQLAYRIISGNVWYDARTVLQDQKIGHYLHVAPRAVLGIQIIATFVSIPVNYAVMRWVIDTKFDYVSGKVVDPTGQWTGQMFRSYNSGGVQFALIGPRKLFASSFYQPVLWGFLLGAIAPCIVWLLHKKFPRARFDLWNTTIFLSSATIFYGNMSTGPLTSFIIGTFTNFFLYRYRSVLWHKWAYISGAALDTGFNANLFFIFLFFGTTGVKMVNWWGNNADNVERCFALKG